MSTAPSTASTSAVSAARSRVFMVVLLGQGHDGGEGRGRRPERVALVEGREAEELADQARVGRADGERRLPADVLAARTREAPAEQLELGPAGQVVRAVGAGPRRAVVHGKKHGLAEQ